MARQVPTSLWLPIVLVICATCCILGLNGPVLSAGTLRLICSELNLPENCDDKIATQTLATWNMTVSIISGCVMFFSVGIWTAAAHVIGRPRTIAIALFGIGTLDAAWSAIFYFPSVRNYWRYIAGSAVAINCCTGTMAVVLLGVFGAANDITHKNKATRTWLFSLLEAIIGSTAILSAKVSSWLVNKPLYYPMFFASMTLYFMASMILFFYKNTIPEKEQQRKIHWEHATLVTALWICIPTKANIRSLMGLDENGNPIVDYDEEHLDDDNGNSDELDGNDKNNDDENNNHQSGNTLVIEPNQSINQGNSANEPLLGAKNDSSSFQTVEPSSYSTDLTIRIEEKSPKSLTSGLLTPAFFLPFLAFAFFATMFVLYGRKTIMFMYFKTEYKITSSDYSNILALDAVGNAITVFLILPIIKKLLVKYKKQRLSVEITSSLLSLTIQGICYTILPLLPLLIGSGGGIYHNKLWACWILLFIIGMASSIPSGIIRAGMINATTKRSQQHRIIACLAALEGLCIILSGLTLNKIYKSFDFIGLAYVVSGSVYLAGALVLFIVGVMWWCGIVTTNGSPPNNNNNPTEEPSPLPSTPYQKQLIEDLQTQDQSTRVV
jgi:hypothetical protein